MDVTILAVDDSLLVTELIREYFAGRGYRVFTAANGRDALAVAEREVPDLIISDVNMPAMNGWEFCAALKKRPGLSDVPFLFLTVEGEDTDVKRGIDLGAVGYLTKPFSFDELRGSVEAALAASGRDLPGAAPEGACPEADELCNRPLPELLTIFLEKGRTGTLHVERGSKAGVVEFDAGCLARARFGASAGPLALAMMLTFGDAHYRFSPEPAPGGGALPRGAGRDYLAALSEALPDINDLAAALHTDDPVVRLGPRHAAMDLTSLLDLATAGFHRTGTKNVPGHTIMPVFEAVLGALKKGPVRLGALLALRDDADPLRVAAHLVRKKIVVAAA